MKPAVFILNFLIQLAVAAFGGLMLLVGLNGFSEEDGAPALIFYLLLAIVSAVGAGAASAFLAGRLAERRALGRFGAAAIAVVGTAVAGVIVLAAGIFVAVLIASAMRGK